VHLFWKTSHIYAYILLESVGGDTGKFQLIPAISSATSGFDVKGKRGCEEVGVLVVSDVLFVLDVC
jgi:hypothetical protein